MNKCFPVGLVVVVTLFPLNTVKAVEGKQRAKMTMTMAMIVATLLPLKTVVGEEGKQRAAAISSLSFRQVQVPKTSYLHLILALLLSACLPFFASNSLTSKDFNCFWINWIYSGAAWGVLFAWTPPAWPAQVYLSYKPLLTMWQEIKSYFPKYWVKV